ncbi:hypothetical protein BJF79_03910 [Actinomadura sp. CNU-125]|uniref:DnaB-like helicase N-terminal domain-containing protein n=1 Tax=Actinomadura sp. CNU-125 TaxID=1904961 RepID=UPI00095BB7A7|nr:DnaB-like helicase N-terminal domain-containing protein [Actinomadura sp. CNU-125]OLT13053.1 hypothetical protein BJF79_03910 [Actinomadura sp. CNU-125]
MTTSDAKYASERALIGAAMSTTDLAVTVVEQIHATDLRDPNHQTIYGTVLDLVGKGSQVSPPIVLSELQKGGHLVGRLDGPLLYALVEEAALPSQVGYYIADVKARAWKARLWQFGVRVQQAGRTG